jgi:lipoprotein-anchoring transpeptidase ErfK/SrfK
LAACGSDKPAPEAAPETLPPTTAPAEVCDPRVADYPYHVAFAKQDGQLAVYTNPGDPAPSQSFEAPRKTDSDLQVMLPVRPNGSTGWVKREDVRVEGHTFRIDISLSGFNLKAFKGSEVVLDAPIGISVEERPTPPGTYYTTELLKSADPAYGPWAFGLSGFSEVLTSFNGGQGQLGIHGTNQPEKVGTRVSSGCIRLKNEDIETLVAAFENMPQGIPVQVTA